MEFKERPRVVISACLGFENCRYNGEMLKEDFIEKLKQKVDFIPVCPETSIGLGIPREVIRIIAEDDIPRLIQPKTSMDVTAAMHCFADSFVKGLPAIDGFVLKGKSPSCGYKDAKHYSGLQKGACSKKGSGVFADRLIKSFPLHPIIDDGQLNDYKYRENYLIKLFMQARLRVISEMLSLEELIDFHEKNRLLIMCYSIQAYKKLSEYVKNTDDISLHSILPRYLERLQRATAKIARYTSNARILLMAAQDISKQLKEKDRHFIEETIEKYRKGILPFSVPLYIIKAYATHVDNTALLQQSLFMPFPEELQELRDSGKARI